MVKKVTCRMTPKRNDKLSKQTWINETPAQDNIISCST